jgi:hypothetical protein
MTSRRNMKITPPAVAAGRIGHGPATDYTPGEARLLS